MSTCISRHGEYSNHAGGDDWSCSRCGIFDVDGVLAALAYTQEQMAQMVPKNWHGLMAILDDIYPESIFPTVPDRKDRGDGARIISLLRYLTEAQQHLAEAHAIDDRLSAELHGGPESTGGPYGWIGRAIEAEAALQGGMVPKNWHGLMEILDDIYPESVFPTVPDREDRGDGARIISLLRQLDRAQSGCT
jgi:hypothetical protein